MFPSTVLFRGGKILGPDASRSQKFMRGEQGGEELPRISNVTIVDIKGNWS